MTEIQQLRRRIVTYVYDGLRNGRSVENIVAALRLLGYTTMADRRSVMGLKNRREQGVPIKALINGYWTNAARFR